jgi:hypothetical protein
MAVPAVWRLVHLLAFYPSEPKCTPTHTGGTLVPLFKKTKSKLLLVLICAFCDICGSNAFSRINNDAVDVIACRRRNLRYLRQVVLRATLGEKPKPVYDSSSN